MEFVPVKNTSHRLPSYETHSDVKNITIQEEEIFDEYELLKYVSFGHRIVRRSITDMYTDRAPIDDKKIALHVIANYDKRCARIVNDLLSDRDIIDALSDAACIDYNRYSRLCRDESYASIAKIFRIREVHYRAMLHNPINAYNVPQGFLYDSRMWELMLRVNPCISVVDMLLNLGISEYTIELVVLNMRKYPFNYKILLSEIKNDLNVTREAVSALPENYKYVPIIYKFNTEIITLALEGDRSFVSSIPHHLINKFLITPGLKEESYEHVNKKSKMISSVKENLSAFCGEPFSDKVVLGEFEDDIDIITEISYHIRDKKFLASNVIKNQQIDTSLTLLDYQKTLVSKVNNIKKGMKD